MERLYVHPLPVRIWHWTNAIGFVLMILTGIQLRYIGLIDWMSFKTAVVVHNWVGWVLIANFFLWLSFYLSSDKIKVYHPELSPLTHFKNSFKQLRYYGYGIFKGDPNPHHVSVYRKFNPMQSMAYQVVMMVLVPLQFVSGVLLWDVQRFSGVVDALGGVRVVDTVHVLIFIFFTGFIFFHPYLASLGHTPSAHFKAMITGYEEVDEHEEHGASPKREAALH
jgi:thiosulfate reductase cytochrome b subunit